MIEKIKDSGEFSKKENVTPIMLQGADKWHRAKILDEDYHMLDFCFDKGTYGVIPRLLYIKKKFSDDINIGELRLCLFRKKYDKLIDLKDMRKIFGTHPLFSILKLYDQFIKDGNL